MEDELDNKEVDDGEVVNTTRETTHGVNSAARIDSSLHLCCVVCKCCGSLWCFGHKADELEENGHLLVARDGLEGRHMDKQDVD